VYRSDVNDSYRSACHYTLDSINAKQVANGHTLLIYQFLERGRPKHRFSFLLFYYLILWPLSGKYQWGMIGNDHQQNGKNLA